MTVGAVVVMFGLLVGLGVLGLATRGASEILSIEVAGICIDAPEPGYASEGGSEWIHLSKDDGSHMAIQISPNPPLDPATFETARAQPGVFLPVAGAPDQFFAAEPPPGNRIAHVTLERANDDERKRLLSGIRFCPEGLPGRQE